MVGVITGTLCSQAHLILSFNLANFWLIIEQDTGFMAEETGMQGAVLGPQSQSWAITEISWYRTGTHMAIEAKRKRSWLWIRYWWSISKQEFLIHLQNYHAMWTPLTRKSLWMGEVPWKLCPCSLEVPPNRVLLTSLIKIKTLSP